MQYLLVKELYGVKLFCVGEKVCFKALRSENTAMAKTTRNILIFFLYCILSKYICQTEHTLCDHSTIHT